MINNKILKAVIFDLDGVITDSAKYHYLAWKSLADELGIPFDEEYNEKLKGISRMESLELILKNGNSETKYSVSEKEKLADRKNEHYKELIKEITPSEMAEADLILSTKDLNLNYILNKFDMKL